MSTVDTVNHVRDLNTNLTPITIPTDAGGAFELPALTYRERLRLAAKLLLAITDHQSTARHQVAGASTVIRQLREDSENNLQAELAECLRIEWELKDAGWTTNPKGEWFDPSFTRQNIDNTLPLTISIERTAIEQ
jgi:hypothetical protein